MIGFKSGMLMLMADENDKEPIVFNTNVEVHRAKWNYNGEIIAVCGLNKQTNSDNIIEF